MTSFFQLVMSSKQLCGQKLLTKAIVGYNAVPYGQYMCIITQSGVDIVL